MLGQSQFVVSTDNGAVVVLVLVFLGAVFGSFTGWVAEEKGRQGLIWFLLGFIFWFVALLAVGLAPSMDDSPKRR